MSVKSLAAFALLPLLFAGQPSSPSAGTIDLSAARLTAMHTRIEDVTFNGRTAVRVTELQPGVDADPGTLALVPGARLRNGTIAVSLAGEPRPGAPATSRGFVGIAFRVQADAARHEYFYLRAANGRAEDQVQRNHASQYASHPDFPWYRLRKEFPGKYEAYVDTQASEWMDVRVDVDGARARLFVHGAGQPVLVVNDLKLPEAEGGVALWIGPHTIGHFANLRVTPR